MWEAVYTVGPHTYIRTGPSARKRAFRRVRVLYIRRGTGAPTGTRRIKVRPATGSARAERLSSWRGVPPPGGKDRDSRRSPCPCVEVDRRRRVRPRRGLRRVRRPRRCRGADRIAPRAAPPRGRDRPGGGLRGRVPRPVDDGGPGPDERTRHLEPAGPPPAPSTARQRG